MSSLFADIEKTAHFSPCRRWRYTLWRVWSEEPYANFICLNPSTADEETDDRTVKKCMTLARNWGYGGICITNIFAWRDTDPRKMKLVDNPVGDNNDLWIHLIATSPKCGIVIAAWSGHAGHLNRSTDVKKVLIRVKLHYLKKGDGEPWHPLYLPNNTKPIEWSEGNRH